MVETLATPSTGEATVEVTGIAGVAGGVGAIDATGASSSVAGVGVGVGDGVDTVGAAIGTVERETTDGVVIGVEAANDAPAADGLDTDALESERVAPATLGPATAAGVTLLAADGLLIAFSEDAAVGVPATGVEAVMGTELVDLPADSVADAAAGCGLEVSEKFAVVPDESAGAVTTLEVTAGVATGVLVPTPMSTVVDSGVATGETAAADTAGSSTGVATAVGVCATGAAEIGVTDVGAAAVGGATACACAAAGAETALETGATVTAAVMATGVALVETVEPVEEEALDDDDEVPLLAF